VSFFARSGTINGLPQLLNEFDVELAPLLQSFGIPLDVCQEDDSLVEIGAVVALLEKAAELCHCPHFGLLLGSRQQPTYYMGIVGLIMQSSPDLETAHNEFVRYSNMVSQGLNWSLETEGGFTTLRQTIEKDAPSISAQATGLAVTHASNVWRLLSNNQWKPQEVFFNYAPHRKPGSIANCLVAASDLTRSSMVFSFRPIISACRYTPRTTTSTKPSANMQPRRTRTRHVISSLRSNR